jgi:hypothetical protein
MRRFRFIALAVPLAVVLALGASAMASGPTISFGAKLKGLEETPAVISNGTGTFSATPTATGFAYTLTYSGLNSSALFAHIHVGQRNVAGAVVIFLCGGGGKPACPPGGGTVTGTITAADVISVPAQGIVGGDLTNVLRAIMSGVAYVNVHTTTSPAGEIRGQIRFQEDDGD